MKQLEATQNGVTSLYLRARSELAWLCTCVLIGISMTLTSVPLDASHRASGGATDDAQFRGSIPTLGIRG